MLLPDKMTKILIVGSKTRIKETIDILYSLESLQLIDFSSEEEGFALGAPLPVASEASQRLLKLRSAEKELEVVHKTLSEKIPLSKIEDEIDDVLIILEAEITGSVEAKTGIQSRIHELGTAKQALEPFTALPLDIDLYKGYESIAVLTGTVRDDPTDSLNEALDRYELFASSDIKFIALFVAKTEVPDAQQILMQNGFSEVSAPTGKGDTQAAMKAIETELEALDGSLVEASEKIAILRKKHEAFILASDEHLSIVVEKAEFPLRIGSTEHSFIIDAWVPQKSLSQLQQAFQGQLGDEVHIEVLEEAPRKEHIHPEEAHAGVSEAHVIQMPPTKASVKRPVNMFSYLTELISTPKYGEIDPTIVIAIVFPLFFGLMVGDVGYGVPFILLGLLGLRKCRSDEWRTISTMLFFGGIWATTFGLFLFGEAFGMHFGPVWIVEPGQTLTQLKVEYPYGTELSWSTLTAMQLPSLGVLSKLHDVKMLLYISLWIGLIHLFLGFCIGVYNETIRHGFKHAFFHKVGWIMILLGGAFLLLFIIDMLILNKPVGLDDLRALAGLGLIIPGVAISLIGEGPQAILELPTLLSNVISYTRLAAIGMSKAGMALAFNMLAIEMIAPAGGVAIIAAILVFMVGHLMIFILAVVAAGIHGIRLHYVEQFQKFFVGGGLKFDPLKVVRKYTTER
jgi:V/A-type H+-transporting ATPase subunit I